MPDDSKKRADTDAPADTSKSGSGAGAATKTKKAPKKSPARKPPQPLPPWKVLLHNDDKNDIDFVVETIVALTPLNEQDAELRTVEAHKYEMMETLDVHSTAELVKHAMEHRLIID